MSARGIIYEAFLPSGYPESVSGDYLEYQIWDSLQAGASSITGILSSRAILSSVGVGKETATATGAVIQWIIKDGCGMLGRVLFTWVKGRELDNNSKTWRLVADIFNDMAFFFEILTGSLPEYLFLPLACTGTVLKAVVGVAGGATRAALTEHQARRNNLADVSAKDGSQEMGVGLLSMILGIFITPLIDTDYKTWICFVLLTILHIFCNYKAVRSVVLEKLNRQRSAIVISHFLKTYDGCCGVVLTPQQVAKLEKTFYREPIIPYRISLGTPLGRLLGKGHSVSIDVLEDLQKEFTSEHYILVKTNKEILIALQENVTQQDILRAYFHAQLYQNQNILPANKHVVTIVHNMFDQFLKALENSGWSTENTLLGATEWRITFKDKLY